MLQSCFISHKVKLSRALTECALLSIFGTIIGYLRIELLLLDAFVLDEEVAWSYKVLEVLWGHAMLQLQSLNLGLHYWIVSCYLPHALKSRVKTN